MKIVIPARMGSKGLPLKNQKLFKYTADSIPTEKAESVWVTTDDPKISRLAEEYGFHVIDRPARLADDTTSIRDVMVHALDEMAADRSELITMLYLTYPERTWDDIKAAMDYFLNFYQAGITGSLLCKKAPRVHPYLHLYEHGIDGIFGRPIVQHDLYRRQDYPQCFEISHFVSIFRASELVFLNKNLYCDSTVFYPIRDAVDVDSQKELETIEGAR
jgi:CMP-N-acetylneuraminic acid synthetase